MSHKIAFVHSWLAATACTPVILYFLIHPFPNSHFSHLHNLHLMFTSSMYVQERWKSLSFSLCLWGATLPGAPIHKFLKNCLLWKRDIGIFGHVPDHSRSVMGRKHHTRWEMCQVIRNRFCLVQEWFAFKWCIGWRAGMGLKYKI